MRDILVTAIVFGLAPFALFEPFLGIALWTWVSVMNPHRLTWNFAYNLPFAQVVAAATLMSLVIASRKVKFPWTGLTVTLIVFLIWLGITFVTGIHPRLSIEMWSRITKELVMTLVALAVVRSERQIQIFFWILVMSVAFFGIKGGVFTILSGGEFRVWGPPGSYIEDNNALSVALIMMIPLMVYLYQQLRNRAAKLGMMAATLLSVASILGSYSRGAVVAGSAMALFLAIKSKKKGLFLALFVIAVPIMLAAMPQKWWDRMATIATSESNPDSSVQGRFNAWAMTWNLAKDRPVLGGGFAIYEPDVFAKYAPNPRDLHAAHSIYFQMLGEHGFPGLGLFLLLALLMWRAGTRVIRASTMPSTRWRADMARALQVSLVGYMVGGITINIGYWDVFYFELVLFVALDVLARTQQHAPVREASVEVVGRNSKALAPATIARRVPRRELA
jgi:probable O-glycosylation ligase (exosortase A-associated)